MEAKGELIDGFGTVLVLLTRCCLVGVFVVVFVVVIVVVAVVVVVLDTKGDGQKLVHEKRCKA